MGTSSCDSADECVVRACQFSNKTVNHGQASPNQKETDKNFLEAVDSHLESFFGTNDAANITTIDALKTSITGKNIKNIDIGAGCIGFNDVFKKESFTHNTSTGSLIACTIISIMFVVAAMFIWKRFVRRRNKLSVNASTQRSIDADKDFTIKRV